MCFTTVPGSFISVGLTLPAAVFELTAILRPVHSMIPKSFLMFQDQMYSLYVSILPRSTMFRSITSHFFGLNAMLRHVHQMIQK